MPSPLTTYTRATSAPAPPDPTPLPRPDTLDPDLYLVLADHVGGDPELHLALAQMVQTLAWCHGRPYPSTALTGTIDETGRHWIRATARHWQTTCPDLHRRKIDRCLSAIRPTGLVLTRRTDRGLRYSLDFALLRRWYYAAGVKESRLTDPAGENPPFVRHDHDLCDVLALSGVAGGAMLGAIIRQIAWWQGSHQGHTPKLAGSAGVVGGGCPPWLAPTMTGMATVRSGSALRVTVTDCVPPSATAYVSAPKDTDTWGSSSSMSSQT